MRKMGLLGNEKLSVNYRSETRKSLKKGTFREGNFSSAVLASSGAFYFVLLFEYSPRVATGVKMGRKREKRRVRVGREFPFYFFEPKLKNEIS